MNELWEPPSGAVPDTGYKVNPADLKMAVLEVLVAASHP